MVCNKMKETVGLAIRTCDAHIAVINEQIMIKNKKIAKHKYEFSNYWHWNSFQSAYLFPENEHESVMKRNSKI